MRLSNTILSMSMGEDMRKEMLNVLIFLSTES